MASNSILVTVILLAVEISLYCTGKRVIFSLENNRIRKHLVRNRCHDHNIVNWVVDARYKNSYQKIGWDVLELETNLQVDRETSAYVTGYAEGDLTQQRIAQHWNNTIGNYCQSDESESCQKLHDFLEANINWMRAMVKKNREDAVWKEVRYIMMQLQGLIDGYGRIKVFDPSIRIKPFGILLLQLPGDFNEIRTALGLDRRLTETLIGSGSCSAFVKLVTNLKRADLYTAHATWMDYSMMLRVMKRYNFPGHTEVFSGYPGVLFSLDDFYLLSSGLVTMETTNGNYNTDLWKKVIPQALLEWVRTMVSNRLAKNGKEWCATFKKHNSGTYNNQWMIIDYNNFNSGSRNEILYVLEQLPGQIEYEDMTGVLLKNSYWASYNIPYFRKIYKNSGMPGLAEQYGDFFTHDKNPRAEIFARDHKKVIDINSLIKLMRSNDYKRDPLAQCSCTPPYSATNAVAARCDLNDPNGDYPLGILKQRSYGATDFKATTSMLQKSLGLIAECGPTHDQQPVFQWSKSAYANNTLEGHPDKFDFKPEWFTWKKQRFCRLFPRLRGMYR